MIECGCEYPHGNDFDPYNYELCTCQLGCDYPEDPSAPDCKTCFQHTATEPCGQCIECCNGEQQMPRKPDGSIDYEELNRLMALYEESRE